MTLRRTRKARETDAVSRQALDEADKTFGAATARLSQAEAAIASIDVDIKKTTIQSPFDAIVARRYVDTGRVIDAGVPVLGLLERDRPEVRIGLGGSAVDSVEVGRRLDVSIDGRVHQGVVAAVLPVRDRAGRAVDVVIELDVDLAKLRSGDLARLEIERTVEERGFWVPVQALTEGTRGLWSLYVFDAVAGRAGHATLRRAEVEVLHLETDRAFIRGPLEAARPFVSGGLHRVAPGMVVRIDASESGDGASPEAES